MESLVKWKEEIQQEIDTLSLQQKKLSEEIARKEPQLHNINELLKSEGYDTGIPIDEIPNGSVADAAWTSLKEIGRPAYYKDLARHLEHSGVRIPGQNPEANLLSYLSRDGRFKRVKRGTYALIEWRIKGFKNRRSRSTKRSPSDSTT